MKTFTASSSISYSNESENKSFCLRYVKIFTANSSLFNESESLQMARARFGLNSSLADR